MATHHISIAKAAFAASLLRPDVTKVSRDDIPQFHSALEAALERCSSDNIQTCKRWLLENVMISAARTGALGKYLTTLSKHLATQPDGTVRTSISRRRLHILYLLNDLLHHAKCHNSDVDLQNNSTQSLRPFLVDLFQLTASEAKLRVSRRLDQLVKIWEEEKYFDRDDLARILDSLHGITPKTELSVQGPSKSENNLNELPYVIPATHGDPTLPFYDLPAGNLMHHIVPNSSQPMRPDEIRALQFSAGPADESLVNALKDFLKDVERIENAIPQPEEEEPPVEIDEMGQTSCHDEAGDLVGDTYYGWSRSFCEKMKKRERDDKHDSARRTRSRSSSRSRSRSHARVHHKRRRQSESSSASSRSSRSYSRSASRSRYGRISSRWGASRSRSRSPSRTRSYTLEKSLPRSGLPPRISPPKHFVNTPPGPPPPPLLSTSIGLPFPPSPFDPGRIPVPPPCPPNWTGPWPPPPPPPPQGYQNLPIPPAPPNLPPPPPPGSWPFQPNEQFGGRNDPPGRRQGDPDVRVKRN
ncbi:uncharacterized protein Z518_00902 [Rhinocladiella mackenziei CBS 650.93]|uniref:CID domain-containing protein n=1 Tax=Rhinocladiella mackenziei CBS 650.93 TaxID=1442369 RepID=A0A0D2J279_9EURO|nr:uncharacterized protein Z518_00902 [Rhinocladiella mackenziei CBS 650.93]KIX09821.1 hypothetical protein Z518_00902 [Rhinocladiella mackenziei CBS 650.93]